VEEDFNKPLRFALGRIMGEIFRIQKRVDSEMCPCGDADIYGLINGIEESIDRYVPADVTGPEQNIVTKEQFNFMCEILDKYWKCPEEFGGYYTIESKVEKHISRTQALKIFTYLNLSSSYAELMEKMDSSGSPLELRRLDADKYEI